jgi:AmpE protein
MILICLILALALELHFKLGSEYRDFSWFNKVRAYLTEKCSKYSFFELWGGVAIVLLTPIVTLYAVLNIFDGFLFGLLTLIISSLTLFLCLGPTPLGKSFDVYATSVEKGDVESAFLYLSDVESTASIDLPEEDELVRKATRTILAEAQKRYFGVLAWFIFFGPIGALFFRLSHLYRDHCKSEEFDEHLPLMDQLIHWIDWIPARITSLLFLLTGDFVNGFYRIQDYLTDAEADNNQLIAETGIAALGLDMGVSDGDIDENHQTMAMVNRTVIFYLVVGAVISSIL